MAKQKIAVDLDDVLSQTNEAVRLHINQHFGQNHTADDYMINTPYFLYWEKVWEVSGEEAEMRYQHFKANNNRLTIRPIPGAIDVLQALKKQYGLIILTARGKGDADATHQWLEKHFPQVFSHVEFVPGAWRLNAEVTKAQLCTQLGVSYLIDDSLEHCELVAAAGLTGLLFGEYGWNKHKQLSPGIHRVKDWSAVLEYFNAHQ